MSLAKYSYIDLDTPPSAQAYIIDYCSCIIDLQL